MPTSRRARVLGIAQGFKGTLSVSEVALALERGIAKAGATPEVLRASDGGDGLLDALGADLLRVTTHRVTGPLGEPVDAAAGWLDDATAVLESRLACGVSLLPPSSRDPLRTTTRGVGELVRDVVRAGARTVLIGLGGSATMDGGMGMARAWGFIPHDGHGAELPDGGGALAELALIREGTAPTARLIGLADVRNPLVGPRGARVYAAQKGAGGEAVERLSLGLDRLATVAAMGGKRGIAHAEGAGAAGGLGFGILFFGRGTLVRGAAWFLERLRLAERLRGARLMVTGEGAFDATSLEGKLTGEALSAARAAGVPAVLLAPRVEAVPTGVILETGGGEWDGAELTRRTTALVTRALRAARAG